LGIQTKDKRKHDAMVTDSSQAQQPVPERRYRRRASDRRAKGSWLWFFYVVVMLFVFAATTPFMFQWPLEDLQGTHFQGGLSTGLAQVQAGNLNRRAAMFALMLFTMFLLSRTKNRFQLNGILGWVFIFYLGWILLSLTWSIDPTYTLRRLVVVYMMWFFAVIAAAKSSMRQLALLAVFVTGMSLAIGIGNELRLHTMNVFNQGWRFSGVFHCVTMGWNCSILALATTFLLSNERRKKYRVILWSILAVALVFLVLTKTRTAVGAAIIALGFYGFKIVPAKKAILIILAIVISLAAGYVLIGKQLIIYGETATTLGRGESAKKTVGDLTGRLPLWKYALKHAANRPLQGYGFSSFINPGSVGDLYREVGWVASTLHSGYLNELMGTGFIGMSALIALLVLALTRAWRLAKDTSEYLFLFSVVLWLVINLFLEAALINGMSFMAFFCMACVARLAILPAEEWQGNRWW